MHITEALWCRNWMLVWHFVHVYERVRVWRHVCSFCGCDGIVPDARCTGKLCPYSVLAQWARSLKKEWGTDVHAHARTRTHTHIPCVSVKHRHRLFINVGLWSFQHYDQWWGTGSMPMCNPLSIHIHINTFFKQIHMHKHTQICSASISMLRKYSRFETVIIYVAKATLSYIIGIIDENFVNLRVDLAINHLPF